MLEPTPITSMPAGTETPVATPPAVAAGAAASGDERGSLWRKWDLHIHTPASFHWNDGPRFGSQNATEKAATLRRIIDKINSSDVAVFGIMDYWTFEGFIEIRNFAEQNPGTLRKCILPGIELRLEAPTEHRLNTHVIFSDSVSTVTLTTFIHALRCGGSINKPPTRETLIEIGRGYAADKLGTLGYTTADKTDDEKMFLAGAKTVVITRTSLRDAIGLVGKENCLVFQPYDTNDGLEDLDWKAHPYDDQELMRWADIFEAKKQVHIDLFLGLGYAAKPEVQEHFMHNLGGCPKPAFRGSDAHKVDDYGKYPNDRIAWLKADPTFLGLKQVCHEPASRCFVGSRPPKLLQVDKNPTKYVRSITVQRSPEADAEERWFDGVDVELNPGLIAVIGNKGSGKSAFADIVALLGNTRASKFEFLNPQRFRKGKLRAPYFTASLTWEDSTAVSKTLDLDTDPKEPERVRYLPQRAIEDLCNELSSDGPSDFEGELKKVIFSHVPAEQQMQKESLDELLDFKTGPSKEAIRQFQATLTTLNSRIVQLEGDTSASKIDSYKNSLALKKAELDAHLASEPQPPGTPPVQQSSATDQTLTNLTQAKETLSNLTTERDNLKNERIGLFTKQGQVTNVLGKLANLETQVEQFAAEISPDLEKLELKSEQVFTLKVDRKPIQKVQTATQERITAITLRLDGDESSPAAVSLEKAITSEEAKIKLLQEKLDAPQRAQQEFLSKKAAWQKRREEIIGTAERPETKIFYEAKISAATTTLPQELTAAREERRTLVRNIHAQLILQRTEYETFYKPVQTIATDSPLTKKALKLDFAVFLSPTTFEDQALGLINRQRRGAFQGEEDGAKKLHDLVGACDFGNADQIIALLDGIIDSMSAIGIPGNIDRSTLAPQLRKDVKLSDFYDLIYSLKYLEPRYTLRLDGKEISELSPGEKGALLLVFYLLLDQEEIPIIIDQPEQNLDNESVVRLLVDCIRRARERRQVILVTHNPNLAIVCDADQIICSKIDKATGSLISYTCGAIENPKINGRSIDVLEGTFPAFDNRRVKWMKPRTKA